MRDPERIEPFLKEVGVLWKKHFPDLRFGQLLHNFHTELGNSYNLEEDEWIHAFSAYCNGKDPQVAIMDLYKMKADEEKKRNARKHIRDSKLEDFLE